MAYTSDQQLAALGLRPMTDLPQRIGFKFLGYMRTGHARDCAIEIRRGERVIVGAEPGDLVGWKPRR